MKLKLQNIYDKRCLFSKRIRKYSEIGDIWDISSNGFIQTTYDFQMILKNKKI